MTTINEYLKTQASPSQREEFERIRKIVKQTVPDATEVISYGVPTFNYKGKYLIYFGAYKNHMSLYPASDELVRDLGEKVEKFRTSKGTLQYTEDNIIPESTIKEIIKHRLDSILQKS